MQSIDMERALFIPKQVVVFPQLPAVVTVLARVG